MMRSLRLLIILILTFSAAVGARGQEPAPAGDTTIHYTARSGMPSRFYVGNGFDLALLSTAISRKPGEDAKLTTPRFTIALNFGFNFHYDLNRFTGFYTGAGIKNIGYIEKSGGQTVKRRVYTVGVPLGVKLGDLRNRNFFFAGAGADFPIHYREKSFSSRKDQKTNSEWFGDETARVMPYMFAGISADPGIVLKIQYYPGNFLNPSYNSPLDYGQAAVKPYQGHTVHLLLLSLGIDIHYNQYKIQEREYREYRRKLEAAGGQQ